MWAVLAKTRCEESPLSRFLHRIDCNAIAGETKDSSEGSNSDEGATKAAFGRLDLIRMGLVGAMVLFMFLRFNDFFLTGGGEILWQRR